MTDIKTMQDMLNGLRKKKLDLQQTERVFLKVSGINEEIEKAVQEKQDYEAELQESKDKRDEAKAKKASELGKVQAEICEKLSAVLPYGGAVFSIDEDNQMTIGWTHEGKTTPYNGLSGGQKQIFDTALANVLDADIIVVEAAEMDDKNLVKSLQELSKLEKQVIVNTCHDFPVEVGNINEFEIVEV